MSSAATVTIASGQDRATNIHVSYDSVALSENSRPCAACSGGYSLPPRHRVDAHPQAAVVVGPRAVLGVGDLEAEAIAVALDHGLVEVVGAVGVVAAARP